MKPLLQPSRFLSGIFTRRIPVVAAVFEYTRSLHYTKKPGLFWYPQMPLIPLLCIVS